MKCSNKYKVRILLFSAGYKKEEEFEMFAEEMPISLCQKGVSAAVAQAGNCHEKNFKVMIKVTPIPCGMYIKQEEVFNCHKDPQTVLEAVRQAISPRATVGWNFT